MRRHARATFLIAALCSCFAFAALAAGAAAADSCPNALVRAQQGAQGLPECRAYEKVTPADKNGGDVSVIAVSRSSADGNAFQYQSSASFAGGEGAGHLNQYVSWRSATGWGGDEALNPYQTPDILAPSMPVEGSYAFSPDLTRAVLLGSHDPSDRSGNAVEDQKHLYLHTKGVGGFTPLGPPALAPGLFSAGPIYGGSSTDMSRVFVQSSEQALGEAPAGANEVYERHDGAFSLVSRLPNGEVASEGLVGQGADARTYPGAGSAVSGDGTQVVLGMGSPSQLYLRENGQPKLISTSHVEGEEGTPAPHGATYMGSASEDGGKLSTIFFASPDLLTEDAEGDPSEANANELYAYDVKTGDLTLISIDTEPNVEPVYTPTHPGARIYKMWVGSSEDASYVYFVANSQLTPDAPDNDSPYLYLWHDGTVRYLGSPGDEPVDTLQGPRAVASRDGKRLLYLDDPGKQGQPLAPEGPQNLTEAYLYEFSTHEWSCISCAEGGPTTGPVGVRPTGTGYTGIAAELYQYQRNPISRDGSRIFFETESSLDPRDTNGTWDVYEWHEGQLNLVSSGRDLDGAQFLDASPDGHDVFIATYARLVPEDEDSLADVYDVRVDGGFLYQPPPPPCSGDNCQGAPDAARSWSSPGSTQVAGAGGAAAKRKAARCAKPRKPKKAKRATKGKRGAKKGAKRVGASAAKAKPRPRCTKPRQAKKQHKKAGAKKHRANAKGKGGNR